jgi:hypothetical protein
MARVRVVYETLRDLVNKDQKGFVTPSVFNSLAGVAQLNIFNRLFDDIKDAHRNRRASFDPGRDKSLLKQMREDLAYFVKRETLEPFDNPDGPQGTFRKPSDLARIISIQTGTRASGANEYDTPLIAEIVYDEEKMNRILRSNLSAPSGDFPVALVSQFIEVIPTPATCTLTYYKFPQSVNYLGERQGTSPSMSVQEFAGVEIPDPQNSFDFELPRHYESQLVIEIGDMIGVNLRDQVVQAFASNEQQSNNLQQSFS